MSQTLNPSQYNLLYQSPALTFSLLLCLSISTSPWALSGHVPPWARVLREPEILMAPGEGHLQHTLQGIQARTAVRYSQSGWTLAWRTGMPRQMGVRWSEANEEKWLSVCVCVKNHVIPATSWLLHMHPVIYFQVIWSFIQGSACREWVDSWTGLSPYSVHWTCLSKISLNTNMWFALSCLLVYAPLPLSCSSSLLFSPSFSISPNISLPHNQTLNFLPFLFSAH